MLDSLFTYTDADLSLTEAEEVATIALAQAGDDDAVLRLMHAYGPALRSAVATFARGQRGSFGPDGMGSPAFAEEDAQNAAIVGFMATIREHDPAKSPRLAGTVRTRLARELADLFESVMPFRVPERTLSRFYGILKAADGDTDAAEALAPDFGMSRTSFRDVLAAVRGTGSLDEATDPFEGVTPEVLATPIFSASPVTDAEDAVLVEAAFRAVEDDEERICRLAYGFTEYDPQPDAEIAHRTGLTRPTVQRKRAKALGKMRKALGVTHA